MSLARSQIVAAAIASSLLLCAHAGAQTLIYACSYAQTAGRLRARFPNGQGTTPDERLAMVRGNEKTEIYSVSMIDGKRTLLFTDAGTNLEIMPAGATLGVGKAYAKGVFREWRTTPYPSAYDEPAALYEISLDGSNRVRKLFETKAGETPPVLNPQGQKAIVEGGGSYGQGPVFIYDVSTWKLLQSWDLSKISKGHCPGCNLMSYGWLAGGDRVFFTLDSADEDDDDSGPSYTPGTYLAKVDGTDLGGLPKHAGEVSLPGYSHLLGTFPYLIAQLPNGDYLFREYATKDRAPGQVQTENDTFIVVTDSSFHTKKQIPVQRSSIQSWTFRASPSGRYLSYIESRLIPNYRSESHLWGRDLDSGAEKELFFAPAPNPSSSAEPNVVFNVLGWVDDK